LELGVTVLWLERAGAEFDTHFKSGQGPSSRVHLKHFRYKGFPVQNSVRTDLLYQLSPTILRGVSLGLAFGVWSLECAVSGFGFRVSGPGSRVKKSRANSLVLPTQPYTRAW